MKYNGIASDFLHELEDSRALAKKMFRTVKRVVQRSPDAEFVFDVVWALHRYEARMARAAVSQATVDRLKAKGRKLGRPPVGTTDSRVKKVKALHRQGKSYAEICARVGVSRSTVNRYLSIAKPQ